VPETAPPPIVAARISGRTRARRPAVRRPAVRRILGGLGIAVVAALVAGATSVPRAIAQVAPGTTPASTAPADPGAPGASATKPAKPVGAVIADRIGVARAAADSADRTLSAASHIQADATQRANTLTARIATIDGTLAGLQQQHDSLDAQIQTQRQNLTLLMVDEYHDAGTPTIGTNDYTQADENRDRKQHLGQAVADAQVATITSLRTQMTAVDAETTQQRLDRRDAAAGLNRAHADYADAQGAMDSARRDSNATHAVSNRWLSVQSGTSTAIMGHSVLSASELANWFVSSGRRAHLTVPISTLAQDYIDEGSAEGVRGDIAFAQSVLETGSFGFPDYGQVKAGDNNFAGIGACDSCSNGYQFPDALTGVRAQIQLLRNYADRSATAARLTYPAVLPNFDTFGLQGSAPTWNGLTGRWASATDYGDKILGVYVQILSAATGIK
jgi:hypothetical protein